LKRPYRSELVEREASALPGVVKAESFGFSPSARLVKADGTESVDFAMVGLFPDSDMFRPSILAGRWLLAEDQAAVVINNQLLNDEPDISLGDDIVLKIEGREATFRVVGMAEEIMNLPTAYVNYLYFTRVVVRETGRTRGLRVTTDRHDEAYQAEIEKQLEARFEEANLGIRSVDTLSYQRSFAAFHFEIITVFLLIMSFLLAVVGGLGLTGTMSINVLERTREIGVMRAIGASNRIIRRLVIIEGVLIGALSWLAAIVVAFPIGKLLSDAVGMQFLQLPLAYTFSLGGVFIWLVVVMMLATVASFWPAQSAARLTVREVLAYE
jgi:putative ABC transport system permease protein